MCWVGFDRALRHCDMPQDLHATLTASRDRVHAEACREGWSAGLGSFTQSYGSPELDASLLLLPLVGFLGVEEPRMAATIERIRTDLDQDGLIRRMRAKGDASDEGAFLPCSLWMADCLRLQGRNELAEAYSNGCSAWPTTSVSSRRSTTYPADVSPELPQALTHLGVVNTALGLCGPVVDRGGG